MKKYKMHPTTPIEMILIDLVKYLLKENTIDLTKLNDVLYDDAIINAIVADNSIYKPDFKMELFIRFIKNLLLPYYAKATVWIMKERIADTIFMDELINRGKVGTHCVNLIKEIIWVSYYLSQKPKSSVALTGTPREIINRMQHINVTNEKETAVRYAEKNEFIANIMSLKDARFTLFPFPEFVSPLDIMTLLRCNCISSEPLTWLAESLCQHGYTSYEKYHYLEFAVRVIRDTLDSRNE